MRKLLAKMIKPGTNGQILKTSSGEAVWGAPDATQLDSLTDVDTTTVPPTDGQALVYDDSSSLWVPGSVAAGGGGSGSGETLHSASMYRSASWVAATTGTGVLAQIPFDSIEYDTNNSLWNAGTPNQFIIPEAGLYHVQASLKWDNGISGYYQLAIEVNGTVRAVWGSDAANAYETADIQKVIFLEVGDIITGWYEKRAGSGGTTVGSNNIFLGVHQLPSSINVDGITTLDWEAVVEADGPSAWLKFNGAGVASTISDATGNGYNATTTGSPVYTIDRDGLASSLTLDGTNDAVHWNGIVPLLTGDWTIEMVLKVTELSNPQAILGINDSGGGNRALWFVNTDYAMGVQTTGSMTQHGVVPTGGYIHAALVNRTGQALTAYLNGVASSTNPAVNAIGSDTVTIGAEYDGASLGDWLQANVDEAVVYSHAFTTAQVLNHSIAATGQLIGGVGNASGGDPRWSVETGEVSVDEFDDGVLHSSWVVAAHASYPGGAAPKYLEARDALSVKYGSNSGVESSTADGATTRHYGLVRPLSEIGGAMVDGDAFVTCLNPMSRAGTNYRMSGLVLSTSGVSTGEQLYIRWWTSETIGFRRMTNWGGDTTVGTTDYSFNFRPIYMRIVRVSSTTWRHDISNNGIHWIRGSALATWNYVPTHVGFAESNWNTTTPSITSYEFLRRVSGVS